jgi:hypothetical protein
MTISRHGVNRHAYGDTQCRPSGGKEIGVAAPPFFYYKEQEELQVYLRLRWERHVLPRLHIDSSAASVLGTYVGTTQERAYHRKACRDRS